MADQRWLPYYGDIPATIPYPDITLYEGLTRTAAEHADHVAVEFLDGRVTYGRLEELVNSAARGLWALGVRPGDRLALLIPNMPHAAVLLYAANRLGVAMSLFHAEAGSRAVSAHLTDFDPTWMAVSDEHVGGVLRLLSAHSVRGLVVCTYRDFGRHAAVKRMQRMRRRSNVDLGGIRGASGRNGSSGETGREAPPVFAWTSFMQLGAHLDLPAHREVHDPDRLAVVLYTGGTTGAPVGVMHTDRQLNAVALQTQVQGPLLAGQGLLSLVPLSHGYGIAVAVHAAVSAAALSIIVPHFTSRELARLVRRRQPEYLVGVPETYIGLVFDRVFRLTRHRARMGAFCGGDRLAKSVRERFELIVRRRGGAIGIREGYGLTETVTACATMPDSDSRPGTVGIPYPDTLIGIAEPACSTDERRGDPAWLADGELGEILVSGPTVMQGYWRREDLTRRAFHVGTDGRTWLRTGDLGRMDADGFLSIVERIPDQPAVPGTRIHPGLAEVALNEHVEVLEACVTARVDGSAVVLTAHVAPVDTDRDPRWLEQHLRDALESLDEEQRPVWYRFHTRLPRTLGGVIDRRRLRRERTGCRDRRGETWAPT